MTCDRPSDARHEIAVHVWRPVLKPRLEMRAGLPGTEYDVNLGACQRQTGLDNADRHRLKVYYHGGGWTFGDIETGDDNCRLLCARYQFCVLNVDYRLAPEHRFPVGINDAFKWAAANANSLDADLAKGFLLNTDHTRLPARVYFQVAGLDPIRNEAMLFARLLREHSGAKTLAHIYDGLPHGFWRFQELPVSRGWADDLSEGTQFLLHGGKDWIDIKH